MIDIMVPPCTDTYVYGSYKLFEIVAGTIWECVRRGEYSTEFILRILIIISLYVIFGLLLYKMPNSDKRKKVSVSLYILAVLFILISLYPLILFPITSLLFPPRGGGPPIL